MEELVRAWKWLWLNAGVIWGGKMGRETHVVCCLVKGGHDGYESIAEGDLVTGSREINQTLS